MRSHQITLLTDFGTQDGYVGVMKGVIAQIYPSALMIDLTHQVKPQDILAARFILLNSYRHFLPGTVHLVVVDPGVGTRRRGVAVAFSNGFLVGPDNGVLSGVLTQIAGWEAVALTNPNYWRVPNPSHTFHGRDIFAPVAAHLASGVSLTQLGPSIEPTSLVQLHLSPCELVDANIRGCIQYIDHFGNLITNISAEQIEAETWSMQHQGGADERPLKNIERHLTYDDVPNGEALSLIGSHGWVEIAVNGGSAAAVLRAAVGDKVVLVRE
ncbi:MAG: SAM-dependent chlorinase/fluorinase [Cyanobacteria bacterium P01_F01_bin.4]